jgi:putative flippase GtrA
MNGPIARPAERGRATWKRLLLFTAIGTAGFLIEAVVLSTLIRLQIASAISGRLLSFPLAVVATWALNRKLTFSSRQPRVPELARYISSQSLGALTNLGAFVLLVRTHAVFLSYPIAALAVGSAAGLIVNYGLSVVWVFRNRHRR